MVVKQREGSESSEKRAAVGWGGWRGTFLYLTRKTPLPLYIGRGEKHKGDGSSWAGRVTDPSVDDLTIWFFWKQRISLWHGKPFEDTNKTYIQEIL